MDRRGWLRIFLVCVILGALLLVPGVALAAKAEGEAAGGGLINLDRSLIVQAVNFLILLVILWKLLYKPLVAKMEERTAAIKRSLEEAERARAEAARQQEENAARLREAHGEAARIREQALKGVAEEQRRLVAGAREEAERLVASARSQMDSDLRRAREELRREVADLATAVAEKLVRKSLREEDHRRVVADAIGRLEG